MMRSRKHFVCDPAKPAVKMERVNFSWPSGDPALQGVNLQVNRGEFVWINGESGSGKSTLHKIAAGLETPNDGSVHLLGHDVNHLSKGKKEELFQKVGIGFQRPAIIPGWTVGENMTYYSDMTGQSNANTLRRSKEILGQLGLGSRVNLPAERLSGGQAQLLELGSLMLTQPDVLLLDEPTSAMDTATKENTLEWLRETSKLEGTSILMVSHDMQSAAFVDRTIIMDNGRLLAPQPMSGRFHGILPPRRTS
jgi:putative ABC transport system ATP-binding protein